jgi:hypothetical protein
MGRNEGDEEGVLDLFYQKDYPPPMEEAKVENAIVAFIDILGYGRLVTQFMEDLDTIKSIETSLRQASTELINDFRTKLSIPEPYDEYSKKLFDSISSRYISDTILITFRFPKKDTPNQHFSETEDLSHRVYSYLYLTALTCAIFIAKNGLVLRGGISMGRHYENSHNGNLFIFSEAYINAYKLEKRADKPRILIDNLVYEFVRGLPLEELKKFFFVDKSGEKCLDMYAFFENNPRSSIFLSDLKEAISRNMFANRENRDALRKLLYFARYHNRRVQELGFGDSAINLGQAEKYLERLQSASPKDPH